MPDDLDQVTAPKNVEITSVRIPLQALLNQTCNARESAAHIGMAPSQATPAHCPVWLNYEATYIAAPAYPAKSRAYQSPPGDAVPLRGSF